MTKLIWRRNSKNSNIEETQIFKLKKKTLKTNCDKTKNSKSDKIQTQILTKFKFWQNLKQEPRGSSHDLEDYFDHTWRFVELFRAI